MNKTRKTFVGPRLRQLRKEREQTQTVMARALGLSATYVNLLENNQRSLSVQVLLKISEVYGVDWRDLLEDEGPTALADLRAAFNDPLFAEARPDLQELRASLDHCPGLARSFLDLHKRYTRLAEAALMMGEVEGPNALRGVGAATPEAAVHDLFRTSRNHFDSLERAAEGFLAETPLPVDDAYGALKRWLFEEKGISVEMRSLDDLPNSLRYYDEAASRVLISTALDYPNRVFQLAHVVCLVEYGDVLDAIVGDAQLPEGRATARCRVELANYFSAALLMPYERFQKAAKESGYDLDRLATTFGVAFEQVCHRVTTLQREGASGVPFFFLRIDKAGNVTKRFNATSFQLAEFGGACPRWDIHMCFRQPGRIVPQFVELPDKSRYFTINRTVDRPAYGVETQDQRLAVTLGCSVEHAAELVYASQYQISDPSLTTPIGINCRLCPRGNCSQRAHQPIHLDLPIDEKRRGTTRFES